MTRATSLLGAELLAENVFFLKKPLVPGSFAAWGRTFSQKTCFFEEATCPGQLRCLGQNSFSEIGLFFEEATCPGQLRCLGQNFFSEIGLFFEDATCPGQLRCLGQNSFSEIGLIFEEATFPGQLRSPMSFLVLYLLCFCRPTLDL